MYLKALYATLFFSYIVQRINTSIRLFADDTSLYIVVETPILSSTLLNSDLTEIYEGASKWLVTFNPNKTESVLFSQKVYKPDNPSLYMIDQVFNEMTYNRYLGLILSNDISWHEHLDYIKTNAWSLINNLKKTKVSTRQKVSPGNIQVIYKAIS